MTETGKYGLLYDGDREVHFIEDRENGLTWCRKYAEVFFPTMKKVEKEIGYFGNVPTCSDCLRAKHATENPVV